MWRRTAQKMPQNTRFRTLIALSVVSKCIIFTLPAHMNEYLWFVAFVSTVRVDISPAFRVLSDCTLKGNTALVNWTYRLETFIMRSRLYVITITKI
jgi:hypothetical protein